MPRFESLNPQTDLSRTNRWTIEAWVRPASFANSAYPTIYSEGTRVASLGLNNGTGKLESWINNNSATRFVSTASLTLGSGPMWRWFEMGLTGPSMSMAWRRAPPTAPPAQPQDSTGAAIGNVTQDLTDSAFQAR